MKKIGLIEIKLFIYTGYLKTGVCLCTMLFQKENYDSYNTVRIGMQMCLMYPYANMLLMLHTGLFNTKQTDRDIGCLNHGTILIQTIFGFCQY